MLIRRLAATSTLVLVATLACIQQGMPQPDPGTGGGADGGGAPPLRSLSFAMQMPGPFMQATIDNVAVEAGPYQGRQMVQVQNFLGMGLDLGLTCGMATVRPPELHRAFALTFNDDGA